jgi:hypothetical protein
MLYSFTTSSGNGANMFVQSLPYSLSVWKSEFSVCGAATRLLLFKEYLSSTTEAVDPGRRLSSAASCRSILPVNAVSPKIRNSPGSTVIDGPTNTTTNTVVNPLFAPYTSAIISNNIPAQNANVTTAIITSCVSVIRFVNSATKDFHGTSSVALQRILLQNEDVFAYKVGSKNAIIAGNADFGRCMDEGYT